ncbi:MAG: AI-2E family transporter [Rhodobacterales bacterium]
MRTDTILLTAGLLLIGYLLGEVILLVFAAVVFAVGLDGVSRSMSERLSIKRGWALFAVVSGIAAIILGAIALTATRLVQQFQEISQTVREVYEQIQDWLAERGVLEYISDLDMNGENGDALGDMAGQVMTYGMSAIGAVSSLMILIVLTLFLAGNPELYRRGAIRLVPPAKRQMVADTFSSLAYALRWWFLGQLVSMALLGVTVGLGLFILGIELWFALAVITALLTFIPFLGPLIATVPIVAVGFTEGMETGLIVLAGYIVIQGVEGNVITPMIHQKAVDLPPALLISVQVLLSLIFGVVGLILAAPLTIVAMVSVQKLWIEYTLGETVKQD